MGLLTDVIDRKFYPGFGQNWDDELFRKEVLKALRPEHCVLDLGAGAGIVRQMNFRGLAQKVCGVDPDERVGQNPFLDEARVGVGDDIPYPDSTFDVVVADNVLEHLEHPERVFKEVARVLKPGGKFLVKTPNKLHYVSVIAQLTPTAFHRKVNQLRGRRSADTFPTRYKVNTPGQIRYQAERSGLKVLTAVLIEGRPEYLRMLWPAYLCGLMYERVVNRAPGMSRFRIVIISVLEKIGD